MEEIAPHIISLASKVNEQLSLLVKNMLLNQKFLESLKKTLYKNEPIQQTSLANPKAPEKTG